MFARPSPLKALRENAGFTQTELSKQTGISATRLSLAENSMVVLTREEEESLRESIVKLTHERSASVLQVADPRLRRALEVIESNRGHKKLFETVRQRGYSVVESAVFTLGRDYPS